MVQKNPYAKCPNGRSILVLDVKNKPPRGSLELVLSFEFLSKKKS
jgi:hypothetical protein